MAGITGAELARYRLPFRRSCGPTTPGINVGNGQVLEDGHPIGLLSRDELIEAIRSHQAHVLKELELDQIVLFARGTYSC